MFNDIGNYSYRMPKLSKGCASIMSTSLFLMQYLPVVNFLKLKMFLAFHELY